MKDKSLSEMQHAYENIPVPEELRSRVVNSMEAAKKELNAEVKKPSRITWFRKLAVRTTGTAAAAMLVITIMANSGENIAFAMNGIPVLGAIAKVVTFREYTHSEKQMEANVKIPSVIIKDANGNELHTATNEMNRQIEAYAHRIIESYKSDVSVSTGEGHETLNLDFDIVTDNERLFALRFDQTIIMAGSMHSVKIYNLDKATGKLITLKDLFTEGSDYIACISDYIKEEMKAQMEKDEQVDYFYGTDTPDLNFNRISPDENFYVSNEGTLILVFDKYEVSPGYMGSVEFEIPTSVIKDIVKSGFVK